MTDSKRGGARPGAGRKPKHGEPTKVMRIPESRVDVVQALVNDIPTDDLDRLRMHGNYLGLNQGEYLARVLGNSANLPPCPEVDPELYEIYLRATAPMGAGVTPGGNEALAIVDDFDQKIDRLELVKLRNAVDSLLIEVSAVMNGNNRLTKAAASAALREATRNFASAAGRSVDDARQREREWQSNVAV